MKLIPDMMNFNPNSTHGRYMALNCVPNQKVTIVSLLIWHQTYRMDITMGSIRTMKFRKRPMMTDRIKLKTNMKQ